MVPRGRVPWGWHGPTGWHCPHGELWPCAMGALPHSAALLIRAPCVYVTL